MFRPEVSRTLHIHKRDDPQRILGLFSSDGGIFYGKKKGTRPETRLNLYQRIISVMVDRSLFTFLCDLENQESESQLLQIKYKKRLKIATLEHISTVCSSCSIHFGSATSIQKTRFCPAIPPHPQIGTCTNHRGCASKKKLPWNG